MNVHPAAAVFPMLADDELRALADDIAANGLQQPIVVDDDERIVDGRNRHAACELAGVTPTFVRLEGDPLAFVLGANVHRRHLTTGQRAMATATVLAQNGKRINGRWQRGSLPQDPALSRGWDEAMRQAGAVLDEVPELAASVVAGERSLDAAYQAAVDRRRAKSDAAEQVAASFGRAVHALLAFHDAPDEVIDRFIADYGPPAMPFTPKQLEQAAIAFASIIQRWGVHDVARN